MKKKTKERLESIEQSLEKLKNDIEEMRGFTPRRSSVKDADLSRIDMPNARKAVNKSRAPQNEREVNKRNKDDLHSSMANG